MKTNPVAQLEAMLSYLLSGKTKWTVAKKMSGELAALTVEANDTSYIEQLLDSRNSELISIAVSALDLMGPLACSVASRLNDVASHPSEQTRRMAKNIMAECGIL